jgi:hypothetical protein
MGPATNLSNYVQPERDHERELRDRDREQEWERERGQRLREREREREGADVIQRGTSPPYAGSRPRYPVDERDGYMTHPREPEDTAMTRRMAPIRLRRGQCHPDRALALLRLGVAPVMRTMNGTSRG